MKPKKVFEEFAKNFKTLSLQERYDLMQKLPRGAVLDVYAERCDLDQLRELKRDFLARGLDDEWATLLTKLGKRHSPHYGLLRS